MPGKRKKHKPSAKEPVADKKLSMPKKSSASDKQALKEKTKKELAEPEKQKAESFEAIQPVLEASEELLALMPAGMRQGGEETGKRMQGIKQNAGPTGG